MKIPILLIASATAALLLAGPPSQAQDAPSAVSLLGAREQFVAAFDAMPAPLLKAWLLRCSKEASQTLLPLEEAVACAMAWDALLRREFRGDAAALLAWWRKHRDD